MTKMQIVLREVAGVTDGGDAKGSLIEATFLWESSHHVIHNTRESKIYL